MQADAALVRSDCGIKLIAIAAVDLNLAVVVNPCDAELNAALRLYDALEYACLDQIRTALCDRLEGFQNLINGLLELRLIGIALFNGFIDALQIAVGDCHIAFSSM